MAPRALPADPARWFGAEELTRSEHYHGPLRRAAVVGDVVLLVVLVGALLLDPDVGWLALVFATGVALRSVAGDLVMDRRAEPAIGATPLPLGRLLVASLSGAALLGLVTVALVLGLDLVDRTDRWVVAVALAIVLSVGVMLIQQRWFTVLHRARPLDDPPVELELSTAAEAVGASAPMWLVADGPALDGPTAVTLGLRRSAIVMTPALLDGPADLRDWVLVHELGHVARGDVRRGFVLSLAATAATAGAIGVLGDALVETGGRTVALLMSIGGVAAVLGGLATAAVARGHERAADDVARRVLGPQPGVVRQLVSGPRARLAPTLWERLTARHPTPAARIRRAGIR